MVILILKNHYFLQYIFIWITMKIFVLFDNKVDFIFFGMRAAQTICFRSELRERAAANHMFQIWTSGGAQRKSYVSDLNLRAAQIICFRSELGLERSANHMFQIWTCAQRKSYVSDLNFGARSANHMIQIWTCAQRQIICFRSELRAAGKFIWFKFCNLRDSANHMIQMLTCAQRKSYDSNLNLRAAQIIWFQIWTCAQRKSYDSNR